MKAEATNERTNEPDDIYGSKSDDEGKLAELAAASGVQSLRSAESADCRLAPGGVSLFSKPARE